MAKRTMRSPAQRKAIRERLCAMIARGQLVKVACRAVGIDKSTPYQWGESDPEFRAAFERARVFQCHALAEQALEIADGGDAVSVLYAQSVAAAGNGLSERDASKLRERLSHSSVNRDRLRVDSLKWYTSKLAPRIFGERLALEQTQNIQAVVILPALSRPEPVSSNLDDTRAAMRDLGSSTPPARARITAPRYSDVDSGD